MAELFFGNFRLDTKRLTLEGPVGRVELRAKALELLLYLIENRGRSVSHRELLEKVWPEVRVTESSITQCISELRHALDDSPRDPRYIETRTKRGYCFIAPIFHRPTEHVVLAEPPRLRRRRHAKQRPVLVTVSVLGILVLSIVVLLLLSRFPHTHSADCVVVFGDLQTGTGPSDGLVGMVHREVSAVLGERVREAGEKVEGALVLVVRCRQWHDIRLELTVEIRQSPGDEQLWGWTWFVPAEENAMVEASRTAAERVSVVLNRLCTED